MQEVVIWDEGVEGERSGTVFAAALTRARALSDVRERSLALGRIASEMGAVAVLHEALRGAWRLPSSLETDELISSLLTSLAALGEVDYASAAASSLSSPEAAAELVRLLMC